MDEETLNKLERITIRIFLIGALIWITMVVYQSCSVSIIGIKNSENIKVESTQEEPNDSIAPAIADDIIEGVEESTTGAVVKGVKVVSEVLKKKDSTE